jgi:hypothetical protein
MQIQFYLIKLVKKRGKAVDSFDLLLNGENQAIRRFIIEANELQWFEQEFSSSDGKSWKQIVEIKLAR